MSVRCGICGSRTTCRCAQDTPWILALIAGCVLVAYLMRHIGGY